MGIFKAPIDYTGFKDVNLNENHRCKIPESWEVKYINDVLCLTEKVDGADKIYFVQGTKEYSEGFPLIIQYVHPFLGVIELYEEIDGGMNNISNFDYGTFKLEDGSVKEIYIIYQYSDYCLFSYDLADLDINEKIYESFF
jgi:hypothetical protein